MQERLARAKSSWTVKSLKKTPWTMTSNPLQISHLLPLLRLAFRLELWCLLHRLLPFSPLLSLLPRLRLRLPLLILCTANTLPRTNSSHRVNHCIIKPALYTTRLLIQYYYDDKNAIWDVIYCGFESIYGLRKC